MKLSRLLFAAVMFLGLSALLPSRADALLCVGCSCTASVSSLSFGNYNPLAAQDTTAMGTVRVNCTLILGVAGAVTVDLSPGTSGSYSVRTLLNGPSSLSYNLFTDNTHRQVWGNGTGQTGDVTLTYLAGILSVDLSAPIYGNIRAGQNVPAGSYSDTITVTITY